MTERVDSTPISRGVELRIERTRRIRKQALAAYRRLVAITVELERQLEDEANKRPQHQDAQRMERLHRQLQTNRETESELDDIILGSFANEDMLIESWNRLRDRLK